MDCPKDGATMTDLGTTNPWGEVDPYPMNWYECPVCGQFIGMRVV